MNEEQLIEFVNWLPSVVPEFKDATPDQIVQALNQMSESDEGQQMLSQLINTFQQAKQSADSQLFKKGGKLAAFVSKYGKGGGMCCKKKAILQGGMVNKISEKMQDGGELATNTSANTLSNLGLLTKAQKGENDTTDWFQSMILEKIPSMNFIQRRELSPNIYVHELSATREGLANPTLGRMIETNPKTGQSDTTYVRFFKDIFTEPIFTNMTGNAKKQADNKFEELRNKANSKGAKIRK